MLIKIIKTFVAQMATPLRDKPTMHPTDRMNKILSYFSRCLRQLGNFRQFFENHKRLENVFL